MNGLTVMKTDAQFLNEMTFHDWYFRLRTLSKSVFQWENLPNGISERWIEKYLFYDGKCVFFKDKEKGFMVAKCVDCGNLNPYDESTLVRPYGVGYHGNVLEVDEDCVIIGNNDEFVPTNRTTQLTAYKLTNIDRAIDVNINAQKTPCLITCDERQRKTMINLYKQWNGNEPVIYGDKSLENNPISVIKTDAPIVFDKLELQKHMILNSYLTMIGVNNSNQDKRERLVDDEVHANNQQVALSGNVFLKTREEAVKKINEMFGLNIKVSMRTNIDSSILGEMVVDRKEVQNDI